jgi:hypothetical protein
MVPKVPVAEVMVAEVMSSQMMVAEVMASQMMPEVMTIAVTRVEPPASTDMLAGVMMVSLPVGTCDGHHEFRIGFGGDGPGRHHQTHDRSDRVKPGPHQSASLPVCPGPNTQITVMFASAGEYTMTLPSGYSV